MNFHLALIPSMSDSESDANGVTQCEVRHCFDIGTVTARAYLASILDSIGDGQRAATD